MQTFKDQESEGKTEEVFWTGYNKHSKQTHMA